MYDDNVSLVQACLNGDQNAFVFLANRYQGAIYGYVFHKIADEQDAKDLTQEIFLKTYLKLGELKQLDRFQSWLYAIAANECRMWRRQHKPHEALEECDEPIASSSSTYNDPETRITVKRAIYALPESQRLVVLMHYFSGFSLKEIAEFLGTSSEVIKGRLFRARQRLRVLLKGTFEAHFAPYTKPDFSMAILDCIPSPSTPSLPDLSDEGDRTMKAISVLFATIDGFDLPLTASMDEIEATSLRRDRLHLELDRIVSQYGGVTDKAIRGLFMATFGTSVTNEEHPACAVLAAVEMICAVENFPSAQIHIGINSGPVQIGEIGTGSFTDTTVYGENVNLAGHITGLAGVNQVLVSPATYNLTKDCFVYEALPPVRGKWWAPSPIPIYTVKDKKPGAERITVVGQGEPARQKSIQEAFPPHQPEKRDAPLDTTVCERKTVTMLYADICAFTNLVNTFKSDPEKVGQLLDMCFHTLGDVIDRYGGEVDYIMGDALMAIFGGADYPERAVKAGLEMLQEMKRFCAQMSAEVGMPLLDLRIGVSTGEVLIRTGGAEKIDYTALGEPVELAGKLEAASENGRMTVDDNTYHLTAAAFDYEALEPIDVDGKVVPTYKVLGWTVA